MMGAQETRTDLNAQAVNARAAAWLERQERGAMSPEDQSEFDAWLEESFAHQTAYWRLAEAWNRADRLRVLATTEDAATEAASRWTRGLRIAAVLGIAAVIGAGALRYLQVTRTETYTTPIGAREFLTLADGSQITLNTDTSLRITADQRKVWLDKGEAYFQIKHDARHPFVVMIGERRVTDLGTSFFIRRDYGRIEVALLQGAARFGSKDESRKSESLLLKPGDEVTATADSMSVSRKAVEDLADALGWRHGVLVFKHTTLAAAAAEFNRYNRERLVVDDSETAKLTISGTFPANDLNPFTEVVQSVFRLRVARTGNEVVLSRR
ncbi:MAG TPA: FecR domain-containing protein [Rhizomicrobium sp.]|nr:FecR domain-containing protein [Rhizomicrobium sp.]